MLPTQPVQGTKTMPEARHLIIRGYVQGVGFRYSMTLEAARLGLVGWVRNRHADSVEAVIAGPAAAIAAMLVWARQGPPGARVEHVAVELAEPEVATPILASRVFEQTPSI